MRLRAHGNLNLELRGPIFGRQTGAFMKSSKKCILLTMIWLLAALNAVSLRAQTTTALSGQSTASAELGPLSNHKVVLLILNDEIINPVTAKFITDGISRAENLNVPMILQMDTPGGMLSSTREIVKRILASKVPVITYVHPSGSRAASAGVFITYASHIAAMSPSTNIGAAHVVNIGGSWPSSSGNNSSDDGSSTTSQAIGSGQDVMSEKIMNDTLAWIEGLARLRKRNVEWAKSAVEHSKSITADEALQLHVINYIAGSIPDLLDKVNGTTVSVQGGVYLFQTHGAVLEKVELTTRQRILNALANPNIAYIFLLIGFGGLAYEMTHPGIVVPGVVGAICLLLAAYALQMLPTNYAAVLLIIAGIGMIIAEIKFTSYGLLTFGGAVCLFFGSLALFDAPGPFMGVSIAIIIPMVTITVAILGLLVLLVIRSRSLQLASGAASFIGETVEVVTPLNPTGRVFFNGTYWNATSNTPLAANSLARIVAMEKLKLIVEPV
jgi:membrane-bound serine protease (ClpP class)